MKKTVITTCAAAALLALVSASTACQEGPQAKREWQGQMQPTTARLLRIGRIVRQPERAAALGLDEAQQAEINALLERLQADIAPLRESVRTAQDDLNALLLGPSPDRGTVDQAIERLLEARADLEKAGIYASLDLRALLSDEQMEQLKEMGAQRKRTHMRDQQQRGPQRRGDRSKKGTRGQGDSQRQRRGQ